MKMGSHRGSYLPNGRGCPADTRCEKAIALRADRRLVDGSSPKRGTFTSYAEP